MIQLRGSTVVITQNQLISLAGSELVTLELAKYLSEQGCSVIIITNSLGDPMMSLLKALKGVRLFVNPSDEFDKLIRLHTPKLVWVHHQLLPKVLLEPAVIGDASYVFHHMSPYHPTEFPVFSRLESEVSNLILFNSEETRDEILSMGVFDKTPKSKISVFGNPAPDEYFGARNHKKELRSLLIVTNHLTEELYKIKPLLINRGVKVTILGQNGDLQERLTPELIRKYDAVVSIGKTVQYALLSRTPVYCYDHFGGPGYLNAENMALSRQRNFSGRNGGKRAPERIANELIDGYAKAVEFATSLDDKFLDEFRLSTQFNRALKKIGVGMAHSKLLSIGRDQVVGLQKVNELNRTIQEVLRVYNRETAELKREIDETARRNALLEDELKQKDEYISRIKKSLPYRLYVKLRNVASVLR